jgi:hypothetical protein
MTELSRTVTAAEAAALPTAAASQVEMEAGTEAGLRAVSPLRVAQAIAALSTGGDGGWDGDIADINLDGGTDIGAALVDDDLILVDDGGAGTNRKSALSRVKTYIGAATTSTKLDDFTAPDDNTDLNVSTSSHGLAPKAVAPAAGSLNAYGIANGETAIANKTIFEGLLKVVVTTRAAYDALGPGRPATTLYICNS